MCHCPDCHSVVAEDVYGTVSCLTGGVIVAERCIVSCLPVDDKGRGNITDLVIEFFSEIGGGFVASTVAFITPFNVVDAILFSIGINSIITNRFTTANVLFVVINEHPFVIVIDEHKHVIESVILFDQFIDLAHSVSSEHLTIVGGEGHGHGSFRG